MRGRITRAILLVSGLVVVVLGLPLAIVVQRFYEDRAVIQLQRLAAEATAEIALPLEAAEIATAAAEADSPGAFSVYDGDGRLLYGDGPDAGDRPVRQALGGRSATRHGPEELVVATPVTDRASESVAGAVRVTQPDSVVEGEARRAWLLMLGGVAVAFVGALVVARRQAQRLAEPVARLADRATGLGRGDFTGSLEPSGIAEVDTVATALDDSAARLTELLARERAFSADVSHQLRTPLAGLRLRLERAQRDGDLAAVEGAMAEVDRLGATVDHLLALARDAQPVSTPLDIDALLRALDERWRPRLADAGRALVVDEAGPLPTVNASAVSIGQVLDVLVDNALHHGAGDVGVRARTAVGGLVIEVDDQGPGIADDELATVFDRHEGTGHGIGLALARTITAAEGGRLVTASGQPPCFHLVLPTATDA